MCQVCVFSIKTLQAKVARLGVSLALLFGTPCVIQGQQHPTVIELVQQFENTAVFWRQMEVAIAIAPANDRTIFSATGAMVDAPRPSSKGQTHFIYSALGDPSGFDVIAAILRDRSERPEGQGIAGARWSLPGQIRADRYYAAHLMGDLKDARAVAILVPLLNDPEISYIIPWSLGQIGGRSAIQPLIRTLSDKSPSMRVLAVFALVELRASEALPELRRLLGDNDRANFDKLESVAEAAKAAIARLQPKTGPVQI